MKLDRTSDTNGVPAVKLVQCTPITLGHRAKGAPPVCQAKGTRSLRVNTARHTDRLCRSDTAPKFAYTPTVTRLRFHNCFRSPPAPASTSPKARARIKRSRHCPRRPPPPSPTVLSETPACPYQASVLEAVLGFDPAETRSLRCPI